MGKLRRKLLTTTMIPAVVGLGSVMAFDASACMCQRKAAAKAYTMALENPEAVADPATGLAAGCGGCGGCGGGGCGGCGAGCAACNPCASECEEDPCNPCAVCEDPCGASLETATGLAAGCGGCGGCGGGGCGAGCAACNPCASECEEDPCNPCAVCEDPCGASLWQPDDGTGVAWNVLTGEPSAAYVAGLLPQGDVPATFDGDLELVAGLADEGIGVVGAGATDPGSRFVPDGTESNSGHWRYTLSVS